MSGDRELGFMTASELLDAYRRKTLSPVEATKAALARIERLEPKLNAFVRYPAWSPLGNQIAYEYAETAGNIWLMELK